MSYAEGAYQKASFDAAKRRMLARFYRAFLLSIASILEEESSSEALRASMKDLTAYHLAGLRAFFGAASQ